MKRLKSLFQDLYSYLERTRKKEEELDNEIEQENFYIKKIEENPSEEGIEEAIELFLEEVKTAQDIQENLLAMEEDEIRIENLMESSNGQISKRILGKFEENEIDSEELIKTFLEEFKTLNKEGKELQETIKNSNYQKSSSKLETGLENLENVNYNLQRLKSNSKKIRGRLKNLSDKIDSAKYKIKSPKGNNVEELKEVYQEGSGFSGPTRRERLYVANGALQLSIDEYLEGSKKSSNYKAVKSFATKQIIAYFKGEELNEEPVLPKTPKITRKPDWAGDEAAINSWANKISQKPEYEEIDTVLGVAAGGIVPSTLVAELLNANLKFIRYSRRDKNDDKPHDIEGNYRGETILVVDDVSETGETFEKIKNHLDHFETNRVYFEAVVESFTDQVKSYFGLR